MGWASLQKHDRKPPDVNFPCNTARSIAITHQQLTLVCAIALRYPPYVLVWSKTEPLPEVLLGGISECICEGTKLCSAVHRRELDASGGERVTRLLGQRSTSENLGCTVSVDDRE